MKGPGTSAPPLLIPEFLDKKILFVILHKVATFHYKIVFPFH